MNTLPKSEFVVDRENATVKITRLFSAPPDQVWAAWTEAEFLDKWWAPRPWKSRTKHMEFKVGGRRLYAMVGPEGEEQWCLADYQTIDAKKTFTYVDAFCDADGNISREIHPGSHWGVAFTPSDESTIVNINIKHNSLAELENIISMGFKEGCTMTLDWLEEYFSSQKT